MTAPSDVIQKIREKLEAERLFQLHEGDCGLARSIAHDEAVSILMPVIELLLVQRNALDTYFVEKSHQDFDRDILKILEGEK